MDKRKIAKAVVGNVASFSVGAVLAMVIAENTTKDTKAQAVIVPVGSFFIRSIIGEQVRAYTDEKIDIIADAYIEAVKEKQDAK